MTFQILTMTPDYLPQFRETLDTVLRESQMFVFPEAPPMRDVTAFVMDVISNDDVQVIAESDGQVLGWCDIVAVRRPTQRHSGVLGLGVMPALRRHGIGSALLTRALADARARGLTRVELFVRSDNTPAISLYERHGFVKEGLLRNHVHIGGTYRDSYLMSRLYD